METRSKNTKRNLISGVINKAITIVMPFLVRTVILGKLGAEYLGLSSLFTSILQVLSLAEMGFSTAIVYSLYKPIAENNETLICALMAYYKKVYRIIGAIILVIGLMLLPFLPDLVNGSWPGEINIYLLYLIFLFNTVISYFLFAYKSALLNAFQRQDIVSKVHSIKTLLQYSIQIIVVIIFGNYYAYCILLPVFTIFSNLITAYLASKYFPQYICKGKLKKKYQDAIYKQVKGLLIGKLSDTSRNSFDNIVLSVFAGLTSVAIYGNYYYIYSSIYGIMIMLTSAMQASVGNSIAKESIQKNYNDLKKFTFIFSWISNICVACLIGLYQPFMKIWVGKELMLYEVDMILFCVYFYVISMNCTRNLYFTGAGLWWEAKYSFILEALGNLLLNIILGYAFGITGILIATIITIVLFNFIKRTNILFKQYFRMSPKEFYYEHLEYMLLSFFIGLIAYIGCRYVVVEGIAGLILRGCICVIIPNIVYLAIFWKTKRFKDSKEMLLGFLRV